MAREVQIITWCDKCLADGQQVEGEEYAGLTTAGTRVIIDLCEKHTVKYVKPLDDLLNDHGRAETKPVRAHRKTTAALGPCPECGKEFHSAQSLGMHRWRKHGVPSQHRRGADAA